MSAGGPPPQTAPGEVEAMPFPTLGVEGWPDLMHHKYVVRDGTSVWTGSTNWTDDSWSRQENVIVTVDSPELAADYTRNFGQLLSAERIAGTGFGDSSARNGARAWFTPRHGEDLSHRL